MTTTAIKSCSTCNRIRNSVNHQRDNLLLLARRLERTQVPAKRRVTEAKILDVKALLSTQQERYNEHFYGECEVG